ncbi:venom allergen-1-like [Haematobia irritans]|uniref:venom allergen-1-like n=1 Tax=Haematobia irritans TaxID=7368 RepID=UPI003F500CBB
MHQYYVLISIAAMTALISVSAVDYCSPALCREGLQHIACGHSGKFAASCPPDAIMVKMSADLKSIIVNAHNEKRNWIAGGGDENHKPACRMATMQWDDELAYIASLNVRQCSMRHDMCRNTGSFKYSGQNLAWRGFFGVANHTDMLTKTVNLWYSEVKHSKMSYINKFPRLYKGPAIGHFTVMVADRNIRIGCAAATYSVMGKPYKSYLVACNYATTNVIDHPIYESCPVAGLHCTTGRNPLYPNLCSMYEKYAVNKWF